MKTIAIALIAILVSGCVSTSGVGNIFYIEQDVEVIAKECYAIAGEIVIDIDDDSNLIKMMCDNE